MLIKLHVALLTVVSSAGHDKFFIVGFVKLEPKGIFVIFLAFVREGLAWSSCEVFDGFIGLASHDVFIASVGLSVRFFKEYDPKFFISFPAPAEDRSFSVGFNGNISVNLYQLPNSIDAEPNQKISIFEIYVLEKSFNKFFILGQTG